MTGASFLARLGLALVRPRIAFQIAADRDHAGRSGSDLLACFLVLLLATQLRGIAGAIWLGTAVEGSLAVRALIQIFSDTLIVPLGFLVVGALVIFAAMGRRREIGRAFDLACVAVLPLLLVDLVGSLVVTAAGLHVSRSAMVPITVVAFAWTGVLVALAALETRRALTDSSVPRSAQRAGWGIAAVALAAIAVQGIWLVTHLESVKPMTQGEQAPAIVLPIVPKGPATTPRPMFDLASTRGRVTVIDFWATWCHPCLKSLPHLDALQRKHPEIAVIAINTDDANDARALFDERGYSMTLVAGDQATQDRYGVREIPHTVVVDKQGVVRRVIRGGGQDLEAIVAPLLR